MVFWFYGILVKFTFLKILFALNPILDIENLTILPKHHRTTRPIQLL